MTSAVLNITAANRNLANAYGEASGWGPNNFSVPMSADGSEPATHYGCRAEVTQGFLDLVASPPPEDAPIVAALIADFSETTAPFEYWTSVLAAKGLARIETGGAQ